MALTVQKQPNIINLAGNPVEFVIASDTLVSSNHKIHIEVYDARSDGSQGNLLGEEALPVVNNSASFDLSDYVKKNEKLDLTIFNLFEKAIKLMPSIPKYFFRIFETYNGDGTEHNAVTYNYQFINGGFSSIYLENFLASGKTFYNEYTLSLRKFLSWTPDKKLTWNQHDFLFFIHGESELYYRITMYFDDDTSHQVDSEHAFFSPGRYLCYINTSYLANELDSYEVGKKIKYYTVELLNGYDLSSSETKTYYLDSNKYNQGRQFIFRNSLGGYDIIHLKGISENTNEIQRTIGFFDTKNDISYTEFTETFEAASGFLVNSYKSVKDAQRYITELFRSNEIYEIVGKEIIPVIPTKNKIDISRDNEFLYSFVFEYKYAYADEYFAPLDTEQYFNPRIFYSNGDVTPSPVNPGQTATVTVDVLLNANASVTFTFDWGDDVGQTSLQSVSLVDGVSQELTSQIVIPGNVYGERTLTITDNLGGRYRIDYVVTDLNMLFEDDGTMLFEDGEQMLFEN